MKVKGSGGVFLAEQAQDIHLIQLENDKITVQRRACARLRRRHRLGHRARQGRRLGDRRRASSNLSLKGTGWVAIVTDGPPVRLDVAAAPTFADAQAAVLWSSGVSTVGQDRRQLQEPDGQIVRRDAADRLRGRGLGADPAVGGRWSRAARSAGAAGGLSKMLRG